ncbi:hypothetical protein J7E96_05710 [Streptomyces sp. ISL-96]|uniref:hypothetical protein n=1 Tax=Streptomyces sp. ISL-96 TaxID=2819191 RepID=UPI001BE9FA13|nr:hypothetical protein [Streptomyces sp. ISL-96]MBT2488036.1 hypothetical protein [Streptomyces sp. ISL-96]
MKGRVIGWPGDPVQHPLENQMSKHIVRATAAAALAAAAVLSLSNVATAQPLTPKGGQHTQLAAPHDEDDLDFDFDGIFDGIGEIGDIGG